MIRSTLRLVDRLLDSRATVSAACAASLAIGLFFIFVWSPLPWGWKGIDFYYEIALSLARGEPFPTIHLVWGYAYFLAFWYRLFGDHQWIPLCVQALLNASIPLMLYHLVRVQMGQRVAVMSAVLAGLFSFNTVYASTQASDSVCTVLVVAAVLCFALGDARRQWRYFAATGLLSGLAYQFRPNLILFPAFLAALHLARRPRSSLKLAQMAVVLAVFALAAVPWVIRNYRWSGLFVPASTHGGVQLWFGTLQSGAYEDSWIYNPRAAFENPPLDYTSIDELPVVVTARADSCDPASMSRVDLVYWTNRNRTPARLGATPDPQGRVAFTLPRQPSPTALYYYFDSVATVHGQPRSERTPPDGANAPLMLVISRDHLRDLDIDGYVLDAFDLVRMMRHVYWGDALPFAGRLDLDADGRVTERDLRMAVALLLHDRAMPGQATDEIAGIAHDDAAVTLHLRDGSALSVPRQWSGKITDLPLQTVGVGSMAALLVSRSRPFATLRTGERVRQAPCLTVSESGANRAPYRRLPHEMRRFTALALDNIRHDPAAYLTASARRALHVFIIEGSTDRRTAYQFKRAGTIYQAGHAVSIVYLALLVVGLGIALARGMRVALLLLPIVYVPLTVCFLLINARYSITAQPFVFVFVAVTIVTAIDALSAAQPRRAVQSQQ